MLSRMTMLKLRGRKSRKQSDTNLQCSVAEIKKNLFNKGCISMNV